MVAAEGVLQAEKDFNLASHPEIEGIPNLQVGQSVVLKHIASNHN